MKFDVIWNSIINIQRKYIGLKILIFVKAFFPDFEIDPEAQDSELRWNIPQRIFNFLNHRF